MVEKFNDEDTQEGQFLTFNIATQEYGINIRHVTEIIGIQKVTDLPDLPDFVKGVINLRGKVIPVVDVRLRFGMDERDYDERTCIVVVNIEETSVGLVVDTVSEVMNIPGENIEPPPRVNKKINGNRFVHGLGKVEEDVKILLDTQKLLFEEELEQIIKAATT
ncbi:MAG: purine-binding chemotaxis protein CheW [Calditrichaeota bacterium]|nr:MAG: chemotaxis protein CheW [Calditrichota bacterium]MBL1203978.1 purine-binding chemotaxis protein CheW [Calditrichota bacterium]NOG43809.1 purine-binding chemotaxis protein CheW [Calditrichota bacterium]